MEATMVLTTYQQKYVANKTKVQSFKVFNMITNKLYQNVGKHIWSNCKC